MLQKQRDAIDYGSPKSVEFDGEQEEIDD